MNKLAELILSSQFFLLYSIRKPEFCNYSLDLLVRTSFLLAYLVTTYPVGVNFIHKFNLLKSFSIAIVVFCGRKPKCLLLIIRIAAVKNNEGNTLPSLLY